MVSFNCHVLYLGLKEYKTTPASLEDLPFHPYTHLVLSIQNGPYFPHQMNTHILDCQSAAKSIQKTSR